MCVIDMVDGSSEVKAEPGIPREFFYHEMYYQQLTSINRHGALNLFVYLESIGFFESPASTKYHSAHPGGLAAHSLKVMQFYQEMIMRFGVSGKYMISASEIVCPLLHDVGKAGKYLETPNGYVYNKNAPKGHAMLSIERITKHMQLSEMEAEIILYHMGPYGTIEHDPKNGEYALKELMNVWQKNPLAKLFYLCDELAANFAELRLG